MDVGSSWEKVKERVPVLIYELKKSSSSKADKGMITREYCRLLNLASTSGPINRYSSSGKVSWTYTLT